MKLTEVELRLRLFRVMLASGLDIRTACIRSREIARFLARRR